MGGVVKQMARFDKTLQKVSPAAKLKAKTEEKIQNAAFGPADERSPIGDLLSFTASNANQKMIDPTPQQLAVEKQRRNQQRAQSQYTQQLTTNQGDGGRYK